MDVTAEYLRDKCSFRLTKILGKLEPNETYRPKWWLALSRATGLGERRVEKLFRKYIRVPSGIDCEAIGIAYGRWLEDLRANAHENAEQVEKLYAEYQKDVAGGAGVGRYGVGMAAAQVRVAGDSVEAVGGGEAA